MISRFARIGCVVLLGTLACVDTTGPVPDPVQASDIFTKLSFSTNAMFIRLGDTLPTSLRATAIDTSNIDIDTAAVHWTSDDSSQVYIDSTGRIIARQLTQIPVVVRARYTHGYTTRTATLDVYVTADKFTATSVRMVSLDSTRVGGSAGNFTPKFRLDLFDGTTATQLNVAIPMHVPDLITASYLPTGGPNGEAVYTVGNKGTYFGKFWVTTSVNLYGNEVRDSLQFTGLYPYNMPSRAVSELADGTFSGTQVDDLSRVVFLQPCAVMGFIVNVRRPVDLVFSDSLAPADGCDSLSTAQLKSYQVGNLYRGQFVGGNLENIQPGLGIYVRRSNASGTIVWQVRDAVTKEKFSVGGRYEAVHVD